MSITLIILIATGIVSASALNNRELFYKIDFQPFMVDRNNQFYRFITHAFVHADWGHLVVKMFVFNSVSDSCMDFRTFVLSARILP